MRLGERAAEHGEILAEGEDEAAVDRAVAGDDAVAGHLLLGHVEIVAAVLDEHVPLLEGVGIEQQLEALARAELALGVLRLDAALAAAGARARALLLELAKDLMHGLKPLSAAPQEGAGSGHNTNRR